MSFADPQRTLLGSVFPPALPAAAGPRALRLAGEAGLATVVSAYLPVVLGIEEAGLVAVFLVGAVLSDRLSLLLEDNRRDVYERQIGGWAANGRTALGILALLAGMFTAYAMIALLLGESGTAGAFDFAFAIAGVQQEALAEREFASMGALLDHNLRVCVVIACLAFLYRSYGAMLALGWNACVWAVVITTLARRDAGSSVRTFGAVLPHLVLESLAYVLTALAFLFASKGMATYPLRDARLRRVLVAAMALVAVGLTTLVLAAVTEAYLTPRLLARG